MSLPTPAAVKVVGETREYLHADLAYIYKRRSRHEAHKISEMRLVYEEDIEGRPCVMVDDMIDTAGTLVQGVNVLASMGAGPIYAGATHAATPRARTARPSRKRADSRR